VCFDSGGLSLKTGAGMMGMKGDMAGAAAVVGLMHALAKRKALRQLLLPESTALPSNEDLVQALTDASLALQACKDGLTNAIQSVDSTGKCK